MRDRHAHIFLEMEGGDACPIDASGGDEMVEYLKLGRPRSNDDARMAALADGLADKSCAEVGGFYSSVLIYRVWEF